MIRNRIITGFLVALTPILWAVSCQQEEEEVPILVLTADFTPEFSEPDSLGQFDITFVNTSENATSYLWDFGDGTNSTENEPTHRYETGGIYTVRLTAYGTDGTDKINDQIARTIQVNHEPLANFEIEACDSLSFAPCAVQFFNHSLNATLYSWDFGDGTTSTESDPVHTYARGGTYTVRLTAKSEWGESQIIKTVFVASPPPIPVADFEFQGGNCTAPCRVVFSDISTDADTLFWDFGDGNTSDEINPEHLYLKGGIYTVRLTARNAFGKHTIAHSVQVKSPPIADFEMQNNGCTAICSVRFTNTSQNALVYIWDFGDGGKSDEESPSHTFTTAGTYAVTLKAINEDGKSNEKTERVVIR